MLNPIKREILGCAFIGLGIILFVVILYINSVNPNTAVLFSKNDTLEFIWKNYKREYIEAGTSRTLDRQQGDITTSEGQAYTMLRAVWMDDQIVFDQSFEWAEKNLKRKTDSLYSWLYGKKEDGTYGVITERGGENTASDADTDIALALLFAYGRWGEQRYVTSAQSIINDIWELEVVSIKGIPYLASNNLERLSEDKLIMNPSYLSPGAYRIFATYDKDHPWLTLVDSSYSFLTSVTQNALDTPTSAAIPPD